MSTLAGTKSNRSAIGATVIASYGGKRRAQAVSSQPSFHFANDPRLHIGLRRESTADIEVRWPSGRKARFERVAADRLVVIEEGKGIRS